MKLWPTGQARGLFRTSTASMHPQGSPHISSFLAALNDGSDRVLTVNGIFRNHVYLHYPSNRACDPGMMVLTRAGAAFGPLSLEVADLDALPLFPRQQGSWRDGAIQMGSASLEIASAMIVDTAVCRPDVREDRPRLWLSLFDQLSRWISCAETPSTVIAELLDDGPSDPAAMAVDQMLRSGVRRCDPALLAGATLSLAGLGQGLTPSGDDFLAGLMMAAFGNLDDPSSICLPVLEAARGRTSDLSWAFLHAAAHGHATAPWRALIRTADAPFALAACCDAIVRYGASSGEDMLCGFMWGLQAIHDHPHRRFIVPLHALSGSSRV
ncbi:oxamate carbamoyltransferase subunit AllH family protein [Gluconobacter wancherniae]|uniref:oxamate carbamoyltransferase subunit AllH family protein n=1 Tax=Gluconobacter wancherniae TaxID=1307955 RepID=UPI001B8D2189|nr:DUF2877 domain-containing protein [Gluconobacter wancherniae]MBS1089706.1 DUF2877 domain-containing protein [Gluconobacter wancherniae]